MTYAFLRVTRKGHPDFGVELSRNSILMQGKLECPLLLRIAFYIRVRVTLPDTVETRRVLAPEPSRPRARCPGPNCSF